MWQIITHNLSVIHTQGLFVVTQIAALNIVREDDICKGLGYVLSMQEAVFIPKACDTSSAMCIKNGEKLFHRIEATFDTKGSRLAITVSRYNLFTLAFCAETVGCMQTNTADDCIHNYKSIFYFVPPTESLFWQNVCFKTPPCTSLKTEGIVLELNTLHVVKELSQMIC